MLYEVITNSVEILDNTFFSSYNFSIQKVNERSFIMKTHRVKGENMKIAANVTEP